MKSVEQLGIPSNIVLPIPTYSMHGEQSCVPNVLRSVVGYFEPDTVLSAEDADRFLGRNGKEEVPVDNFCQYLLEQGNAIHSIQAWDEARFVAEGAAYARTYYRVDTDNPRVDPQTFDAYYTDETVKRLQEASAVTTVIFRSHLNYTQEVRTPTYDDILNGIRGSALVAIVIKGSGAGGHFSLVNGFEYNPTTQSHDPYLFSPQYVDEGAYLISHKDFVQDWLPEDGILTITRV